MKKCSKVPIFLASKEGAYKGAFPFCLLWYILFAYLFWNVEMITVADLCGKNNFPRELDSFAIWDMWADNVAPIHLQSLYFRAKLRTSHLVAKSAVDTIARDISNANFEGFVHNDRLNNFSIADSPMLIGDLKEGLLKLDVEERRCVFFALIMGWSIHRVLELTWPEVKSLKGVVSDAGWDVLDSLPRHFKNELVFWRNVDGAALPLVDLEFKTEMAFGCSYDNLRSRFASMVFLDPELAAQEVKQHFGVID